MSKLTYRLRYLISLDKPENGGPYGGVAAQACVEAMSEASDALEAQEARIAGLIEVICILENALIQIAESRLERVGYDQTDIEEFPDLSAEQSMNLAREALSSAREHDKP